MTGARPRRLGPAAFLLLAVAALVLGLSSPASAHATLISTDPAEGAVLQSAPEQVRLTFSEAVRGVPDGIQVFDSQGGPVEASPTVRGAELTLALSEPLGEGTTVVVWRVVSEDGHPISGSLTFSVGASTSDFTPPEAGTPDDAQVPGALTVVRWLGYLGLFLSAGLVVFLLLLVPTQEQAEHAKRRLVGAVRAAAALAVVAWLAGLPLTAVYLLDGGADALTRRTTWSSLPPTEYAVPAAVAVGLTLAAALLGRGAPSGPRRVAVLVATAVAVSAPALTGHTRATTPEALTVATDVLHLMAGSVWLGGLAGLALVLPDLAGRGAMAAEVLSRFSSAAAGVLAALVATGSVLAWRILGSWGGLLDTTYGQLLLVKLGLVLVVVAIAAWNRWSLLPRLRQATKQAARPVVTRSLRRATTLEAVVLVAVLLVTSVLVDRSPEGDAPPASTPSERDPGTRTATLGDIKVRATVTPLTAGPNTVTIQLRSPTGEPTEGVAPPVVRLSSDRVILGAVPLTPVEAGSYTAQVVLPAPGTWQLQVSLRVSEFANPVSELEFVVPGG